jgi:predicted AlkP superfamily phosphohydrolase/phosphomutase
MRRIAIVGFDSLDMGLIKRWAGAGDMPTFRRLLSDSYARSVRNPQGFEAGSVWPSFSTGFGPAEHGQFDGMQCFDRQAYQKRFLEPSELTRTPFWRRVADAGKRAAVIDVPYSFREERFNGIQIVDWLTHVTRPDGIATNPAGLAAEIVAKYGDSPFDSRLGCPSNFADVSSAEAVRAFVDRLAARIERKGDCARDLYCAEDWPLFVVAFHDAHDVGHMCWHLHDETHELHDRSIVDVVGDPIKETYVALDRALDELLRTFDDQTTALIYCSHGIRAERTATGFLDEILTKLEGVYNARSPEEASSVPERDLVGNAYRAIVPQQVRKWVRRTEVYGRIGQRARNADRMAR